MNKMGNSELFNKLVEAASTVKTVEKTDFGTEILNMLKTANKKSSLADIFRKAQLGNMPEGEPLGGPVGGPTPGPEVPPEGGMEEPVATPDEAGDDRPKKMIAEALVALCGGDPEAACDCIRECAGGEKAVLEAPVEGAEEPVDLPDDAAFDQGGEMPPPEKPMMF